MKALIRYSTALLTLAAVIGVLHLTAHTAHADEGQGLSISGYTVVESARVGPTSYDYTVVAEATNNGPDAENVSAVLVGWPANVTVIEGELSFGDIPSGATVMSYNLFKVRLDRSTVFDGSKLVFEFRSSYVIADYKTIAAGGWELFSFYSMAIKTDGSLWAWGSNYYGQIGDGTTQDTSTPVKIMDSVVSVSAGGSHTMAIRTDGNLWAWGVNNCGQIGDGTGQSKFLPVKIMDSVLSVSAGGDHTMAIRTDGSLWAWGCNDYVQLGDGTSKNKLTPVKIMDSVLSVSAGLHHTMAIKTDGSLWAWGSNGLGQLGDGTGQNKFLPIKIMDSVVSVSTGSRHTVAIRTDGSLWAWGRNDYVQLGDGTTQIKLTPVKIMDSVLSVSTSSLCHLYHYSATG